METWYVIQVFTGHEEQAVDLIKQIILFDKSSLLKEVFVPKRKTLTKTKGRLIEGEEPLFPGYVIAVSGKVERLEAKLKRVPAFTKLLGNDGMFIGLNDAEVAWICAFTHKDHRVIDVSEGFVEGGQVVVTRGPLVGREGMIKKINRRKRTAYIELYILGRTVETKVGLNLVKKSD